VYYYYFSEGETMTSQEQKDAILMAAPKSKIVEAIADCNRYIAKEGSRSADLRPAPTQQLLDWYCNHRAKLLTILETR
jgi:hypothetical protein